MVHGFVLDYMHLVLLGVMKRLFKMWFKKNERSRHYIGDVGRGRVNRRLKSIRKLLPCEFKRKSFTLDHISFWKAQEFRIFLLYTGNNIVYYHFLKRLSTWINYVYKLNTRPFLLKR